RVRTMTEVTRALAVHRAQHRDDVAARLDADLEREGQPRPVLPGDEEVPRRERHGVHERSAPRRVDELDLDVLGAARVGRLVFVDRACDDELRLRAPLLAVTQEAVL